MEKKFDEKVTIKAGGAFRNFRRFALAHCICENSIKQLKIDWARKCHKQRQISTTLGEECQILVLEKKTER